MGKLRFVNIQQMVGKFFSTFDLIIYIFKTFNIYIYICMYQIDSNIAIQYAPMDLLINQQGMCHNVAL
jgi:hypothetical protein